MESAKPWWSGVPVPEGCVLRRKQVFEYTTPDDVYRVELFENPDGSCYAIGVPEHSERLIVYGSNVVDSPELALRILTDKIRREGRLFHPSEPEHDSNDANEEADDDREDGEV
ncbi:hypothetical protein [Alicyclobacillus sp.]|uniref:hypothetical protein n=1 Tax=Alicyclobacillus sp. TaxID=61169 RepID=UPI0025C70593|nr:hypothetical protein [Alicyclobacillus sp.]MCL6515427.1 hypothetical protein [Alicyclobacillus sp.]